MSPTSGTPDPSVCCCTSTNDAGKHACCTHAIHTTHAAALHHRVHRSSTMSALPKSYPGLEAADQRTHKADMQLCCSPTASTGQQWTHTCCAVVCRECRHKRWNSSVLCSTGGSGTSKKQALISTTAHACKRSCHRCSLLSAPADCRKHAQQTTLSQQQR